MKSRRYLPLTATLLFTLAVTACQQQEEAPAPEELAQTTAPDAKPGISLSDGTLMLPVVAGRPGAVYFKVKNDGEQAVSIAGVYVEGAGSAEMHETRGGSMSPVETVEIPAKGEIKFERGGLHVMAFDISDELAKSGASEITLTFSDGDKLSAPVNVVSMSGDGMAGMDHGGVH